MASKFTTRTPIRWHRSFRARIRARTITARRVENRLRLPLEAVEAVRASVGRGAEVRTCEFTNYCEALDQKHKPVTCQLWDKLDLDAVGTLHTTDGKRRLVAPDWTVG